MNAPRVFLLCVSTWMLGVSSGWLTAHFCGWDTLVGAMVGLWLTCALTTIANFND